MSDVCYVHISQLSVLHTWGLIARGRTTRKCVIQLPNSIFLIDYDHSSDARYILALKNKLGGGEGGGGVKKGKKHENRPKNVIFCP